MDVVDALPLFPVGEVLERALRGPYWPRQKRPLH